VIKVLLSAIIALVIAAPATAHAQATWYRRDGSISPNDPTLRTVRGGNHTWTYNSQGQLLVYGIRHGNKATLYDARGRVTGRGVFSSNGATLYDARGRFISSTPDLR
jgi:hypothetical protein